MNKIIIGAAFLICEILFLFCAFGFMISRAYAGDYIIYARKPTGKIINARVYSNKMEHGKIPLHNCIIIPVKGTREQIKQLVKEQDNFRLYKVDWEILKSLNVNLKVSSCLNENEIHQPFLEDEDFVNISNFCPIRNTFSGELVTAEELQKAYEKSQE